MNIDKKLLEKQVKTLSRQLNKDLSLSDREDIEGLLNMLGDILIASENSKEIGITITKYY